MKGLGEFIGAVFVLLPVLLIIWGLLGGAKARRDTKRKEEETIPSLINDANRKGQQLLPFIGKNFLVQPCFQCHEFKMRLLNISPNHRSIQYQCVHCGKKMRAVAGTPEAAQVADIWGAYVDLTNQYNSFSFTLRSSHPLMPLEFETVPGPLPYEQTTRTPIPEAVRTEVWRRDQGRCVNCGSKENLQFDHIIPVSQGGATSAKNLQLLCQSCNLTKSAKI